MIEGTVQELDIEGGRCIRIGTYTLQDGDEAERRIFITSGWASSPPLPVHAETVDVPLSKLPAIRAVLEDLEES